MWTVRSTHRVSVRAEIPPCLSGTRLPMSGLPRCPDAGYPRKSRMSLPCTLRSAKSSKASFT